MQTCSIEEWKPVEGYEDEYAVSSLGSVKSLSRLVRYVHGKTGVEMWRRTNEHICATQLINSGYYIVHFSKHTKHKALLVHRLVALAFLPLPVSETVNHINGIKTDNRLSNLEWNTYTENHIHAVEIGLNKAAIPVRDPDTGERYASIARASANSGKGEYAARHLFIRER